MLKPKLLTLSFSLLILCLTISCENNSTDNVENPVTQIRDTIILRDTLVIRDTIERTGGQVAISADKMNVFYIGADNPISISASGVSSNDLRLNIRGGGGKLKNSGPGRWIATVTTPGSTFIEVSGPGLAKTRKEFRVKRIPDPVARISNSSGGTMGSGEFKAQGGVLAYLNDFDFDARCAIESFSIYYVGKRRDPIQTVNQGPRFTAQARRIMNMAKPGDIYFFDNVRARCPGDQAGRKINSMVFQIR